MSCRLPEATSARTPGDCVVAFGINGRRLCSSGRASAIVAEEFGLFDISRDGSCRSL